MAVDKDKFLLEKQIAETIIYCFETLLLNLIAVEMSGRFKKSNISYLGDNRFAVMI